MMPTREQTTIQKQSTDSGIQDMQFLRTAFRKFAERHVPVAARRYAQVHDIYIRVHKDSEVLGSMERNGKFGCIREGGRILELHFKSVSLSSSWPRVIGRAKEKDCAPATVAATSFNSRTIHHQQDGRCSDCRVYILLLKSEGERRPDRETC